MTKINLLNGPSSVLFARFSLQCLFSVSKVKENGFAVRDFSEIDKYSEGIKKRGNDGGSVRSSKTTLKKYIFFTKTFFITHPNTQSTAEGNK